MLVKRLKKLEEVQKVKKNENMYKSRPKEHTLS